MKFLVAAIVALNVGAAIFLALAGPNTSDHPALPAPAQVSHHVPLQFQDMLPEHDKIPPVGPSWVDGVGTGKIGVLA